MQSTPSYNTSVLRIELVLLSAGRMRAVPPSMEGMGNKGRVQVWKFEVAHHIKEGEVVLLDDQVCNLLPLLPRGVHSCRVVRAACATHISSISHMCILLLFWPMIYTYVHLFAPSHLCSTVVSCTSLARMRAHRPARKECSRARHSHGEAPIMWLCSTQAQRASGYFEAPGTLRGLLCMSSKKPNNYQCLATAGLLI